MRRKVVTLDAWEAVPPGNETALMQAVSKHPVAVGMCCGEFINVRACISVCSMLSVGSSTGGR